MPQEQIGNSCAFAGAFCDGCRPVYRHAYAAASCWYRYSIGFADGYDLLAKNLAQDEGVICALETAHAVAYLERLAPSLTPESVVVINLSGRGDKDMETVVRSLNLA